MNPRTRLQVLTTLARHGRVSWGQLLDSQDASIPEFHATLDALQAASEISVAAGMCELGGASAARVAAAPLELRCDACDGRGYRVAPDGALLRELERLLEGRPAPDLAYDQGAITPADCLLRAAFLDERGDLLDRDILLVGDFDLVSLALALTRRPRRIVVIDIDTRVIDFVNAAAAREGLALEAFPFDVRHPLPAELASSFDVFLCDPVETLPGIRLYLSRGASALRGEGCAAYVGLTTIEASRRKWFDIQGALHDMGFALTDARRRFSGYPDHDQAQEGSGFSWPILEKLGSEGVGHRWYTSAFLRAEAVRALSPAVTGTVNLGPELYVDDEAWATPRTGAGGVDHLVRPVPASPSYVPLHPSLQRYDPAFVDPVLLRGDRAEILTEEVEQLYAFRLFTPEFCRLLIEEAEHCGRWRTAADVEENPYTGLEEESLPDTTLHLTHLGALDAVYREIVERHLRPLIESTWRTYRMAKVSAPYVLRYSPDAISSMGLHNDLETVTLVVYLNQEFEGGGTHFPRWKYSTGKRPPGSAIVYPGGLSHEHEGLAITSGVRYLFCGSFY